MICTAPWWGFKNSLLFQPETFDQLLLLDEFSRGIAAIIVAAEIGRFLVELRRCLKIGGILGPLFERIMDNPDDCWIHSLRAGYAERRVRHHVDSDLAQGRRIGPVFAARGGPQHQQPELTRVDQ